MTDQAVRAAYSTWADEYTALLGTMDAMHELDRQFISRWATAVQGHVVDAGCGPGHWTSYLSELGVEVEGVDLVPAFVELAQTRFPSVSYRVGNLIDLGLLDASVAGILAWYSLIHLEPERMPVVLQEFARCLRPGGTLVVGFLPGERWEPFAHRVVTAYFWPVDQLARHLEDAGFVVQDVVTRENVSRPDRPHGAILAQRLVGDSDPGATLS